MTITPPYKNNALGLGATFLALGTVLGSFNVANAATILSTDFTGRTVAGATASNINWTTNGVSNPGNLTADFNLFNTADTANLFAVNRNLHTQGDWVVNIPIAVGAQAINLTEISLDAFIFNGSGVRQGFSRDFDMTIELFESPSTLIATQVVQNLFTNSNTIPNPDPVAFVFDFIGNTLQAGANYFFRLTASGQGSGVINGNNGGFDNFVLTGDLITTPEPTSVITLIGVGVLGVVSKLKKKG